jgi:DNA-binding response OmpR family regulator
MMDLRPHVLVIDYEPAIAELMRELLEEEGFRVSTRSDAFPDPDEIRGLQPSLIVLDYLRPGQSTGWPLLLRLRLDRDTCVIPVVLCTGATSQVKALGGDLAALDVAVVLKPFDIDELLAVVWGALSTSHAA